MRDKHKPNPEETAKWEKMLAKEGMPSELGEDKAAAKLREELDAPKEKWDKESDIRREFQRYWQFRAGSSFGEHLQAAQDIANRLGIEPGDVDEALMKEVEEEVAEAQLGIQDLIDKICQREGRQDIHPRRLANMLWNEAREKFKHIDETVMRDIIDKAVGLDQ